MKDTPIEELQEDFETLLSLAVEVKKGNTDKFMTYFREQVDGLVSKYFDGSPDYTRLSCKGE